MWNENHFRASHRHYEFPYSQSRKSAPAALCNASRPTPQQSPTNAKISYSQAVRLSALEMRVRRRAFSPFSTAVLVSAFGINCTPSKEQREAIAVAIGTTERRVQVQLETNPPWLCTLALRAQPLC